MAKSPKMRSLVLCTVLLVFALLTVSKSQSFIRGARGPDEANEEVEVPCNEVNKNGNNTTRTPLCTGASDVKAFNSKTRQNGPATHPPASAVSKWEDTFVLTGELCEISPTAELDKLANTSPSVLTARLLEFLKKVRKSHVAREANRLSSAPVPTVILLLSNMAYSARFDELIATYRNLSDANLAMIALDTETAEYFENRGIPSVDFDLKLDNNVFESSIREVVLRGKFEVTRLLLLAGYRVLFVEMDIYCISDPLLIDNDDEVDFIASEHNNHPSINIGLFLAKPRCTVLRVFQKLYDWVHRLDRKQSYCDLTFDQKLMDYAVRGTGMFTDATGGCAGFAQKDDLYDSTSKQLRFAKTPYERISHLPIVGNRSTKYCVHIWSGIGNPARQMTYAYENKYYPLASAEIVQAIYMRLTGNKIP